MRYLIAGAGGMLGGAFAEELERCGQDFAAPAESEFDITSALAVDRVVGAFASASPQPGVLLNAAAYTDVERAEQDLDVAFRVNATAPHLLAEASQRFGLKLVHISTDFVFDGRKQTPYVEDDETSPLSVYGTSKLAGERGVLGMSKDALVVRTAWSYCERGSNFPLKVLAGAREHEEFAVVADEVGSPTYVPDLALGVLALVAAGASGLYHLAGAGSCSRFELAGELLALTGSATRVTPTTSSAFPSRVRRPQYSVLDCSKAARLGVTMPHWRDALGRFVGSLSQVPV
jgi:dTDP-4-dehydrorhamnose reductase